LLLARDRLGIKPLYYHIGGGSVTFASEIKSLLMDKGVPAEVDAQALSNFLTLHYVPGPRTMFRDIRKLQPGHTLTISGRAQRARRYWELKKDAQAGLSFAAKSEDEAAERIYSELKESVRKRMQSDVPVGALLSGGLDSSAILGLMSGIKGSPVPSFTVGYSSAGDDGISEFKYARAAAAHFKSDNHEVVVTADTFLDFLPKAVWHQDEPIGEPASIPLYFASKLAKDNGVTVLLTGEGSDELFAGYNRHWGEILSNYYLLLPGFVRETVAGRLIKMLPRAPLLKKGHRSMSTQDFRERYMSWHTVFTDELKGRLLKSRATLKGAFPDVFEIHYNKASGLHNLDKILLLDLNVWLPDDLLMKKDKMGMATAIEARVPFLDYSFVETAFQVPQRLKVHRLVTKYILKKSMERLLPRRIIYRKKEGFPTPISRWLRGELREFMLETLCSEGSLAHGFFDKKTVGSLVSSHLSGAEDNGRMLFPLINFELWHGIFISNRRVYKTSCREVRNMAFNT
ncbi:MAG: asparagine synthase (glutamine-hydrolyzing), partial [Deltaproteobacteria bacterium]|nr:asparagine synthase (glutamine-hydrolyzing) [Deltaproteobacteria bacterium]